MKITKIGHCCLLIETKYKRILTDPGAFTDKQNNISGIDIVLITHEHADHLHTDSVKKIIINNPQVEIFTNSAVGKKLDEAHIAYTVLEGNDSKSIDGLSIEAFDHKHEEIFEEIGQVQNTGYLIAGELFYPGDAFCDPMKEISVLALPVAGPWCKIGDSIRYALKLKPKFAFPVHDGMIQSDKVAIFHKMPEAVLSQNGIEFVAMRDDESKEFQLS